MSIQTVCNFLQGAINLLLLWQVYDLQKSTAARFELVAQHIDARGGNQP